MKPLQPSTHQSATPLPATPSEASQRPADGPHATSRAEARAAGLKRYTSNPCRVCGGLERYTANKACVACMTSRYRPPAEVENARKRDWEARNRQRHLAHKAAYRQRHAEAEADYRRRPDVVAREAERLARKREAERPAREAAEAAKEAQRLAKAAEARAIAAASVWENRMRHKRRKNAAAPAAEARLTWLQCQPMTNEVKRTIRRTITRGPLSDISKGDMAWLRQECRGCAYCGSREALELDHKLPLIQGGRHNLHNVQWLCHDCNHGKGWMDDTACRAAHGIPETTPWDIRGIELALRAWKAARLRAV